MYILFISLVNVCVCISLVDIVCAAASAAAENLDATDCCCRSMGWLVYSTSAVMYFNKNIAYIIVHVHSSVFFMCVFVYYVCCVVDCVFLLCVSSLALCVYGGDSRPVAGDITYLLAHHH